MGSYHDHHGDSFNQDALGSPHFFNGSPTRADYFACLRTNDRFLRSSKAALLPGACADGIEARAESGGAFHVWSYLGWGESGEPNVRTLVDVDQYQDIVPGDLLKNRVLKIGLWWYSAEKLTGSFGITYRMPGQRIAGNDDDTRCDYEVFSTEHGLSPAHQGHLMGFYSGPGNDDGDTGNHKGVISIDDDRFTFWVASNGDLKVKYDGSGHLMAEYHVSFYAKIMYSPKLY